MRPESERDFGAMTALAFTLGFFPAQTRSGDPKPGFYRYKHTQAQVDLTACDLKREAILRTAVEQFAEQIDEAYQANIEKDLTT